MAMYRVRFEITGWVEVAAESTKEAISIAGEKGCEDLIADKVGRIVVKFDEVELNP